MTKEPGRQLNPKITRSMLHNKGGGSREGIDTFMSNTSCRGIEN